MPISVKNGQIIGYDHTLCPHCEMDIRVDAPQSEATEKHVDKSRLHFKHHCPKQAEPIWLSVPIVLPD